MIKQNQKHFNRFLVLIDAVIIYISFLLAWYIRFKSGLVHVSEGYLTLERYTLPVLLIIPVYLVLYNFLRLYDPSRLKGIYNELLTLVKVNIIGFLIFVLALFIYKEIHYSRVLLLLFIVLNTALSTMERSILRLILRLVRKKGYNQKHSLVIGCSNLAIEFLKRVEQNKYWGYNVLGILDDNKPLGYMTRNAKIIGKVSDLDQILSSYSIDEVFITLSIGEYKKLSGIIENCEKSGVRTQIIPDYYKYIPAKPYVEDLDGLPIINIRYIPLDNIINRIIKRILDILVSIVSLVIFSPIMLFVYLSIKITSPGPVIFKQERVGYNKKIFTMYKFRSMHIQSSEDEKKEWTVSNDPRKTWLGKILRKTSLDELPQLFNVLKGDMSLVGPRPEREYFVEQFKEEIPKYMIKHQVKPGMTGWAQINGWRGDTSIKNRIECDLYYIENWSLLLDLKILFFTVFNGFVNKNAY